MPSLPPLNALRAFEATVRLGSVKAAAEALHVTHGAVSRHLKTLEAHFGCELLERAGRGLRPNAEGTRLYDGVHRGLEQLQKSCDQLSLEQITRPLVLRCPGSFLARWLIPRWEALKAAVPDIDVQVAHQEEASTPAHRPQETSLLFIDTLPGDARISPLQAECIGPVTTPALAEKWQGTPASALAGTPLLYTASRTSAWPQWATACGVAPDGLVYGQGFEHLYYLLEAATSGIGIAIAPRLLVEDDLRAGRLVAPWGFVETPGQLVLWSGEQVPAARHEALAHWFRAALAP